MNKTQENRSSAEYLGDGVYIRPNTAYPGGLILFTENGWSVPNIIFLDSEVLAALQKYLSYWHHTGIHKAINDPS